MIKILKNRSAITLIALTITIVVLIILAGVAITLSLGENGLLKKAGQAKQEYANAIQKEETDISKLTNEIESQINGGRGTITIDKESLIDLIKQYANPTGTILAYSVSSTDEELANNRLLKCEGQEISRTDYAELFSVIGTAYGEGDGSTTFNVPNLTGKFLKGNTTAGINESAGLPNITGTVSSVLGTGNSGAFTKSNNGWKAHVGTSNNSTEQGGTLTFNASLSNNIYGKSTTVTPENVSVLYCIKY